MVTTQSQYTLLIFDWDGTIADTIYHIIKAVSFAADAMGFPTIAEESIRDIIGLGLEEALKQLLPDLSASQQSQMAAHYRHHYQLSTSEGVELFPGVEETIKLLHANGHDIAVATGKSRQGLNRAMLESGLSDYIHYSRCADETFSKPHPQMLEEIIDIYAVDKARVLMIGDSQHDLQMALNAGISAAAVTYGAQSEQCLLKFKPATCFNDLRELPGWLQNANCLTVD